MESEESLRRRIAALERELELSRQDAARELELSRQDAARELELSRQDAVRELELSRQDAVRYREALERVGHMRHEFLNLLSVVQGFSAMLVVPDYNGDREAAVQRIHLCSRALFDVVQQIHDFISLETGKADVYWSEV